MLPPSLVKPTVSETSLEQRHLMVRLKAQGHTYAQIATALGCSPWTVRRWVQAARRVGEAGLAYKSRHPHRPHPQTTPPDLVARIQALRQAHPHWGARLIHRHLALEGWAAIPSEVTIHAWLKRLGFGLVHPPTGKPRGWTSPVPTRQEVRWQIDFKEKGGPGS
jgi:transposase